MYCDSIKRSTSWAVRARNRTGEETDEVVGMKKPFMKDPAFRITFVILVVISIVLYFWDYSRRYFGKSRLSDATEIRMSEQ